MTGRGWWTLFSVILTLIIGLLAGVSALALVALTVLLWFVWEWLLFSIRLRTLPSRLRVVREVHDERGSVTTLWAGRSFSVRVGLHINSGRLPFVAIADPVPFSATHEAGPTTADGQLESEMPLELDYRIHCPLAGLVRFEGLRVEVADLHGFFAQVLFVRVPLVLRVLPRVMVPKAGGPTAKRDNQLPPPGMHRLRQPGSGSELLDLRDYIPGDPPRTIAWKVSARRDKLVTREYESEVPVRATIFLDASSSVRIPSPLDDRDIPPLPGGRVTSVSSYRALDQLIEIAAGAIRANAGMRDLTGLCIFDEHEAKITPSKRTARHVTELMQLLGETAGRGPIAVRADPEQFAPIAFALAREVYPDLLRQEVNRTPIWLTWLAESGVYSRHWRGFLDALYKRKRRYLLLGTTVIPLVLLLLFGASLLIDGLPVWIGAMLLVLLAVGAPVLSGLAWLLFTFSLAANWTARRQARVRKQLAAIFSVRYGPCPGALQLMMEDDDLYSLYLQKFLIEHQVPVAPPLYDAEGKYLFASGEKLRVVADAIVRAAAHGKDNELFVVLADLVEFDEHQLEPLLAATRVALGRHHKVLVICAWPRGVPLPHGSTRRRSRRDSLGGLVAGLSHDRLHINYARLRRAFARLGIQVACAGSEESVPLILDRMQRLRAVGGRR